MPDGIDADPSRTAEIETGRPEVVSSRVQSGGKSLCVPVSELIGREGELAEVTALVTKHRLVTLTGEGGIGKTHLAIEVARHLLSEFVDGAWVAELAPLADPELVPVTVATALGLELAAGAMSAERVANALGGKQLMLVLDNCEHVIDAAARMAQVLLHTNAAIRVLATSREPLRVEGEHCIGCHRSLCRLKVPTIWMSCCDTARSSCS